ncbi:hypothetical protein ACTXG6_22985 [Pseudonocardia sp. Cha107L01]|uniref:hypothetical protein n=1 Tax=Pseudonocardia sp. Cha107L01 TaxID=3457576 RepID=UPI00403E94B1
MADAGTDSDTGGRTAHRPLWPALLCVLLVLLAVAWVAGRQSLFGAPDQPASLDAVRLGPDPGAPVAAYLAGLPARWPAPGAPAVPALVQFGTELDGASVARLLAGVTPATAVIRVPLPRVQTALRFEALPPVDLADPVLDAQRQLALAQQAAARDASAEAGRLTGRAASVARYEAAVLGGGLGGAAGGAPSGAAPGAPSGAAPGGPSGEAGGAQSGAPSPCRCVLAVLVVGDRAALSRLAEQPAVRAVDAAPAGTPTSGVALAPLLPEQTQAADPVPDDGPVPSSTGRGPGPEPTVPGGS